MEKLEYPLPKTLMSPAADRNSASHGVVAAAEVKPKFQNKKNRFPFYLRDEVQPKCPTTKWEKRANGPTRTQSD